MAGLVKLFSFADRPFSMNRLPTFSPTPGSQQFYQQVYYPQFHPQIDPQLAYPPEMAHQLAQGRMAIPMQGYPAGVVNVNPHYASPHDSDMGPSPFLPESPFGHGMELPPVQDVSPMMMPQHIISPTEHLDLRNQMLHPDHYQQQHMRRRPNIAQRHTLQAVPRPTPLLRQQSLQPTRSASPHMMQGDIFDPVPHATGSPVRRPNSSLGLMEAGPSNYEQFPDMNVSHLKHALLTNSTFKARKASLQLERWVPHPRNLITFHLITTK